MLYFSLETPVLQSLSWLELPFAAWVEVERPEVRDGEDYVGALESGQKRKDASFASAVTTSSMEDLEASACALAEETLRVNARIFHDGSARKVSTTLPP